MIEWIIERSKHEEEIRERWRKYDRESSGKNKIQNIIDLWNHTKWSKEGVKWEEKRREEMRWDEMRRK